MNLKTYLLWGIILLLAACSKTQDDTPMAEVTLEVPEIKIPEGTAGPQTTTATFTTTAPWTVGTSDTKAIPAWVHVQPMSGGPGTVTLTITTDENETYTERTAYINIKTGGITKSITLTQPGNGTLPPGEAVYEMGPARDTIVLKLRHSSYVVKVGRGQEWIVPEYRPGETKYDSIFLVLSQNATSGSRAGDIQISDLNGGYKANIGVSQPSALLSVNLDLLKVATPAKGAISDELGSWVDSVSVTAFDNRGKLIFRHDIPKVTAQALQFQVMPRIGNIQNFYPATKIYVVANSNGNLNTFSGTEADFQSLTDTAVSKLFGTTSAQPPLTGVASMDLKYSELNNIRMDLAHVTAQVTFKVFFDPAWLNPPKLEKLSISGFKKWGYLFPSGTNTAVAPSAVFNPAVEPNGTNQYLFFAYEKSLLILTVRVGGRYYQGIAPDILKRGYRYTFNMRLCEDGHCLPSSESSAMAVAPDGESHGMKVVTVDLRPV